MQGKVVLVGLDGASLDIIKTDDRKADCITFAEMMDSAASGSLTSTILTHRL